MLAALINDGFSKLQRGLAAQAGVAFERALRVDPRCIEALVGSASALLRTGRPREALSFCERALCVDSRIAEVQVNCAAVYLALKRPHDALVCCDRALRQRPDMFEANYNRGEALLALGRPDDALHAYDRSLARRPDFVPAHCGQGHAYREMGDQALAQDCYRRALKIDPNHPAARVGQLLAVIPVIPLSERDVDTTHREFASEILRLQEWVSTAESVDELAVVGIAHPFALAYQNRANKHLLMQWGTLCAALMSRWSARRVPVPERLAPRSETCIRLGIVTAHLREHSVFRALLKGWLEHLDGTRIHISLFSTGYVADSAAQVARGNAVLIDCVGRSLIEVIERVRSSDIDMLLYPEIGMDPITVQMASLRLARYQAAAWGHPETSGLPTIDYYVSAAAFEPPQAESNYSEQLIRLPSIGCYYEPLGWVPEDPDPAALGISSEATLLLCPGVPYKYAPEYDDILVDIVQELSTCQLVFFQSRSRAQSAKLMARVRARFQAASLDPDRYVVMVPWLSPQRFFGLMRRADIYLDTIGFSGFNTVMQAVECQLPIVAYEAAYLRGRFASGILRAIGLDELVATSATEYVQLTARLARDERFRNRIRACLGERQHALYRQDSAVDALTQFISGVAS